MKEATQKWIGDQCEEIEHSIATNNTKNAFQLVKTLNKQQQCRVNNIQYKDGKCLAEGEDKTKRWTEYFSELYTFQNKGDASVLISQEPTDEGEFTILRQEVESAINTLKCGKAAGVDNVPADLITHGGQPVVEVLHAICNKIWETGKWPSTWTESSPPYLRKATFNCAITTGPST